MMITYNDIYLGLVTTYARAVSGISVARSIIKLTLTIIHHGIDKDDIGHTFGQQLFKTSLLGYSSFYI